MRQKRQQAVAAATAQAKKTRQEAEDDQQVSWHYWTTVYVSVFHQWRVVLCTKHETCFAKDTLPHHLTHQHGSTKFEAGDVIRLLKNDRLASKWKDVLHPDNQIPAIPNLPEIRGFSWPEGSCSYCTIELDELFKHGDETGHNEDMFVQTASLQTLSSNPAEVKYFEVLYMEFSTSTVNCRSM